MPQVSKKIVLCTGLLTSCFQGPGLFEQSGAAENFAIVSQTKNGATTGTFSAASSVTQTLGASTAGEIAGAELAIPPGALSIDTAITIEPGQDLAALTTSSLGVGSAVSAATPVVISSSQLVDTNVDMTIRLPLPASTSLLLTNGDYNSLGVVFIRTKASENGARFMGFIPRNQIDIVDGFALTRTKYFGSYQTVILDQVVEEAIEAPTEEDIVTKQDISGPPGEFSFVKPEQSETESQSIEVEWTAAEKADTYKFWLSTNESCVDPINEQSGLRALEVLVSLPEAGTVYHLCVEADNGKGEYTGITGQGKTIVFNDDTDVPLDTPTLVDTDPVSPSYESSVAFKGTAPEGSTVSVYDNPSCTGTPVASGTAALFASSGLQSGVLPLNHGIYYAKASSDTSDSPCAPNGLRYSYPQLYAANPGSSDGIFEWEFSYAVSFNGGLFMAADSGDGSEPHFFKDGTVTQLADIYGSGGSSPRYSVVLNGVVYFRGFEGSSIYDLWRSDGTVAGTYKIPLNGGSNSNPMYMVALNNKIYMSADTGSGHEFVSYEPATNTITLVKDIFPSTGSSSPSYLTVVGSTIYFTADDGGTDDRELWKSDGTSGGTVLVKNINPNSNGGSNIYGIYPFGNVVYFSATNGSNGEEVWVSDGSSGGTVMISDIYTGSQSSYPREFSEFNGEVYFYAYNGTGRDVYKTDGTTVTRITTNDFFAMSELKATTSGIYFSAAADATYNYELWFSNGSGGAGTQLGEINSGGSAGPNYFATYESELYFRAYNGSSYEVYTTQGASTDSWRPITNDGTGAGVCGADFLIFDSTLYFYHDTTAEGMELYSVSVD